MLRQSLRAVAPCIRPQVAGMATHSAWTSVPMGPPDAILGLTDAFNKDTDPRKVICECVAYRPKLSV